MLPFVLSTDKRQNRSLIQDVTPFLNNIIFQYTNPLPFETEPHTIQTTPLVKEHCDSYLYYIRYKTFEITPSQNPFQVIFISVKGKGTGTYYRTIHQQNITFSIQDVFITYMQTFIEFNENQDTPLYLPSHLEDPQVKVFTQFLVKFLRFNYQLLWEQQDQQAYVNFPQVLTETELLPYIIENEHRHLQYRDLTSFNTTYFEQIILDHTFLVEHSETSDSRPYIITNVSPETTPEEQTLNVLPQYIRQNTIQLEQDNTIHLFQSQEPHQLNPLYPQLTQTSVIQPLNPS